MHGLFPAPRRACDPLDLDDTLALVSALGRFHRFSTFTEDRAIEAAGAGRGAWLTIGDYHNQSAVNLCETANVEGLATALARHADNAWPSAARHELYLLATLLPLNRTAKGEYADAITAAAATVGDAVRGAGRAPVPATSSGSPRREHRPTHPGCPPRTEKGDCTMNTTLNTTEAQKADDLADRLREERLADAKRRGEENARAAGRENGQGKSPGEGDPVGIDQPKPKPGEPGPDMPPVEDPAPNEDLPGDPMNPPKKYV